MVVEAPDLWALVRRQSQVDPVDLSKAIVRQIREKDLDYRSRLLLRDGIDALRGYWGSTKFDDWFASCPYRQELDAICREPFDKVGFPTLRRRIVEKKTPEQIRSYFQYLSNHVREETKLYIAGSCALILPGLIARGTDDIDIVDEVPREIREQHALLEKMGDEFGLVLGHVQRHYFPAGWEARAKSYERFGRLAVYLVDVYDVFLSKLFSARLKDLGDLRLLAPQIDKNTLTGRIKSTCAQFVAAPRLKELATNNWAILFNEELPTIP